jgi:hypothetical protein
VRLLASHIDMFQQPCGRAVDVAPWTHHLHLQADFIIPVGTWRAMGQRPDGSSPFRRMSALVMTRLGSGSAG